MSDRERRIKAISARESAVRNRQVRVLIALLNDIGYDTPTILRVVGHPHHQLRWSTYFTYVHIDALVNEYGARPGFLTGEDVPPFRRVPPRPPGFRRMLSNA